MYTFGIPSDNQMDTKRGQNGYRLETQDRLGKDRLGKDIYNSAPTSRFVPPTVDEVRAYCQERNNKVDPERFVDFYQSKDWLVGKVKMKDWKAALRNWEKGDKEKPKQNQFRKGVIERTDVDYDEFCRKHDALGGL